MSKLYDVVARVGSYTDANGQEKGRFQNVGAIIQNSNGGQNLLLAKWFNPAGLAEEGKESIILSLFAPQQNQQQAPQQQPMQQQNYQQPAQMQQPQQQAPNNINQDVPF